MFLLGIIRAKATSLGYRGVFVDDFGGVITPNSHAQSILFDFSRLYSPPVGQKGEGIEPVIVCQYLFREEKGHQSSALSELENSGSMRTKF